jgi:uncharacterized protein (DUF58 family)
MPTSRTASFLLAALVLYFFANQTQIGWIYVMSALMGGVVVVAWWLGRGSLNAVKAEREIGGNDEEEGWHEGDAVTVSLTLRNTGRADVSLLRTSERCPLLPADHPPLNIFVPSLPAHDSVRLDYAVTIDRRGLREFPPLSLETRAPFGFFVRRRTLPEPTRVLTYPEVRRIRRLSLLDRQVAAQLVNPRAGLGSEVIGVRPFRAGDSPRHIHWRTVARIGHLASKEFADESHPGLTLALDLFAHPYSSSNSKHTPFEYAVKIAASLGDYALRRNYPLHLAVDESAMAAPSGAVTRIALLEYLARVQPNGTNTLGEVLVHRPAQSFLAVVLPWPDPSVVEALLAARYRGVEVLAVVLDPETFPAGGASAHAFADGLGTLGLDLRLIKFGDDWAEQLVGSNERELNPLTKTSRQFA